MKKSKSLYLLLACVSILFILHTLVKNYWIDPGASGFLSHKTGLKRELNLPVWLNVMYVHVAFACVAMASGLINFSNRILEKSYPISYTIGVYGSIALLLVIAEIIIRINQNGEPSADTFPL
ncbi:hypothetical protein MHH28_06415 [Paenibacillus sp. FSL K6-1217]